jgi:tetratricopeptide (TPR) repeat protein
MFMALGIAIVTTYLALKLIRLVRSTDLAFYRFNLKRAGTVQRAGWVFASFAVMWIGFNAHSGWVRYHEAAGTRAYERVRIPDELALARINPKQWLTQTDRDNISAGMRHFRTAANTGLFVNSTAMPKRAWLEYLGGNTETAADLLAAAAANQNGQARALSNYYRGAILNRLGRYDEALESLDRAISERPDLVAAREARGESLWHLGRRKEAVAAWTDAVEQDERQVVSNNLLAGAAALSGSTEEAAIYEKQADRLTPTDPLFHWMVGLRLENVGMNALAEKHFNRAMQLNPRFRALRNLDLLEKIEQGS